MIKLTVIENMACDV